MNIMLVNNNLTNDNFWVNYWKDFKPEKLGRIYFDELLNDLDLKGDLLEVGGFPGRYAIYFNKIKKLRVTILDKYIDIDIINKMERLNDLAEGTIKTCQGDFLTYNFEKTFDIVCSFGLIEHFDNTELALKKHIALLKNNGTLLVNIPNFRGLNGLIQFYFDKRNFNAHNTRSMDLDLLKEICERNNLVQIKVFYYGKPRLWLETDAKVKSGTRKIIELSSKIISRIPFSKNRFLAPYIFIIAKKYY